VGKPKDGDARACYAMMTFDPGPAAVGKPEIDFVRVEYDVERTAHALERSPLPSAFADMLRKAY